MVSWIAAGRDGVTYQARDESNFAPGWLIKVDRSTGKMLGYANSEGNHGMTVAPNGDLLLGPGPARVPAHYRRIP